MLTYFLLAQAIEAPISAPSSSVGDTSSPGFWILFLPTLATMVAAVSACLWALAAKLRAEALALALSSDRILSANRDAKLDKVLHQTDGTLGSLVEANKELNAKIESLHAALAKAQENGIVAETAAPIIVQIPAVPADAATPSTTPREPSGEDTVRSDRPS